MFDRLGISAPGDGFSGYLYVSAAQLEAVPGAHAHQLGGGVGLPMAHLQDNDWSGKCSAEFFMVPCSARQKDGSDEDLFVQSVPVLLTVNVHI